MLLQYISDTLGIKTDVVIPVEDWDEIKKKYPDIASDDDDIPQWQMDINGKWIFLTAAES